MVGGGSLVGTEAISSGCLCPGQLGAGGVLLTPLTDCKQLLPCSGSWHPRAEDSPPPPYSQFLASVPPSIPSKEKGRVSQYLEEGAGQVGNGPRQAGQETKFLGLQGWLCSQHAV